MDISVNEVISELQKCVKCGICQSVCPLYKELFQENLVARGRIALMNDSINSRNTSLNKPLDLKNLESADELSDVSLSIKFRETIDKCMVCLNCQSSCPQGINYEKLITYFRHLIHERYGYNPPKRLLLKNILKEGKYKELLYKTGSYISKCLFPLKSLNNDGSDCLNIPLTRFPYVNFAKKNFRDLYPEEIKAKDEKFRVGFFVGCAIDYFMTDIGKSLIVLCKKFNITVIIPENQTCCGLPAKIYGDIKASSEMIDENIRAFKNKDVDYIVTLCSSCGKELKNMNDLFSDKVVDFTELYKQTMSHLLVKSSKIKMLQQKVERKLAVTYHVPCHLRCGQGIFKEPIKILKELKTVDFIDMDEADSCCGLAGTFGINERAISKKIGEKKADNIIASGADIVTTSCPACIFQISNALKDKGSNIKTMHIVQLLNKLS